MECPSCRQTLESSARFCKQCGASLSGPTLSVKKAAPDLQPVDSLRNIRPEEWLKKAGKTVRFWPYLMVLAVGGAAIFLNFQWGRMKSGKPSIFRFESNIAEKAPIRPEDFDLTANLPKPPEPRAPSPPGVYGQRDVIYAGPWAAAFRSVKRISGYEAPDRRLILSREGWEFIEAEVEIQNVSREARRYSIKKEPVSLKDADGTRHDLFALSAEALSGELMETLAPHQGRKVKLTFEIPEDKLRFLLVFHFEDGARGVEIELNPPSRFRGGQ